MNAKLTILIAVLLLLAGTVIGIRYINRMPPPAQTPAPSTEPVTLPQGKTTPPSTTTQGSSMTVPTQTGSTLQTLDFIHNGTTLPDPANPRRYELAGSLPYCTQNMPCAVASTTDFSIFYDADAGSFSIGLFTEPLGETRRAAKHFLLSALGINETDLCSLNYYVGTTYRVNANFDDRNLGFEGCPGATPLP